MWIPDEVRKCVVFICVEETQDGQVRYVPRATGFVVSVPFQDTSGVNFMYLVTAKHCVEKIGNRTMWIRLNNKSGKRIHIKVNDGIQWITHPDDAINPADIVVVPFGVSDDFDYKSIPSEMFVTKDQVENGTIAVGNDVFIIGLFSRHFGEDKNHPIVRTGSIAMLPDEKIETGDGKRDAYLIEARSIGGISGSPVFFLESPMKNGSYTLGQPAFRLGGLIHGHWDIPADAIDAPMENGENTSVNMGIAIVTPAYKIWETLNQPPLLEIRKQDEIKYISEHPQTTTQSTLPAVKEKDQS